LLTSARVKRVRLSSELPAFKVGSVQIIASCAAPPVRWRRGARSASPSAGPLVELCARADVHAATAQPCRDWQGHLLHRSVHQRKSAYPLEPRAQWPARSGPGAPRTTLARVNDLTCSDAATFPNPRQTRATSRLYRNGGLSLRPLVPKINSRTDRQGATRCFDFCAFTSA
jgi:hypothetical protein